MSGSLAIPERHYFSKAVNNDHVTTYVIAVPNVAGDLKMPRRYTRTTCRGQWSMEALQAALAAVKSGMHLREAAKKFGIPATTRHRHHKGNHHVSNQIIIMNYN